jgi:AcrR family transcriptional regulator
MPKAIDPAIEERILKAAMKLWNKGGEDAVSMRKVAIEAKTSTPTIYERFPNKKALMIAIREHANELFLSHLDSAKSATVFFAKYVDFGEKNPRQYELLFGRGWKDRRHPENMPAVVSRLQNVLEAESRHLAKKSKKGLAFAIWALLHGTVMLRIAVEKPGSNWPLVKRSCLRSCDALKESNLDEYEN